MQIKLTRDQLVLLLAVLQFVQDNSDEPIRKDAERLADTIRNAALESDKHEVHP